MFICSLISVFIHFLCSKTNHGSRDSYISLSCGHNQIFSREPKRWSLVVFELELVCEYAESSRNRSYQRMIRRAWDFGKNQQICTACVVVIERDVNLWIKWQFKDFESRNESFDAGKFLLSPSSSARVGNLFGCSSLF